MRAPTSWPWGGHESNSVLSGCSATASAQSFAQISALRSSPLPILPINVALRRPSGVGMLVDLAGAALVGGLVSLARRVADLLYLEAAALCRAAEIVAQGGQPGGGVQGGVSTTRQGGE